MADVELMSMLDQLFQAITGTGTVLTIISVISFHHLFTIKSHDDQPDDKVECRLDIWIFVTIALKSQDDQHDDKGEYRLDILIMGYL